MSLFCYNHLFKKSDEFDEVSKRAGEIKFLRKSDDAF